jgi:DNA-binding MarR family transcriptional regulator
VYNQSSDRKLVLDDQLCFSLYTASRLVTRAYAPLLAELGLTYPQYITMIALWEAAAPTAVGELGERLHLDSGTLTPLLKRLEAMGLVTRSRDGADERRVLVSPTAAGEAMRSIACLVPERMAARYGAEAAHLEALKTMLDGVIAALDESPAGAGAQSVAQTNSRG